MIFSTTGPDLDPWWTNNWATQQMQLFSENESFVNYIPGQIPFVFLAYLPDTPFLIMEGIKAGLR